MRYPRPLVEGTLVRRYKRFLADVRVPGDGVVTAHCANPGSMATCAPAGARAWLLPHDLSCSRRRLEHTWELVEAGGSMVCVNTARANQVVGEALRDGRIAELAGYDRLRAEARVGERSRIDFLLETGRERCYVEVKMVTLAATRTRAAFPDSVTERGTRHLRELVAARRRGHRAVLLFCCGRSRMRSVEPADGIDPVYGRALRRAAGAGVELLAYRCSVTPRGVRLVRRIPVELPPLPPG